MPVLLGEDPLFEIGAVGVQAQLAGQLNLNLQLGAASAEATSDYVDVTSYQDPSGGNGIIAEVERGCLGDARSDGRAGERERGEHHLAGRRHAG